MWDRGPGLLRPTLIGAILAIQPGINRGGLSGRYGELHQRFHDVSTSMKRIGRAWHPHCSWYKAEGFWGSERESNEARGRSPSGGIPPRGAVLRRRRD